MSLAPHNPFSWQVSPGRPLDEPRQMAYLVSSLGLASRGCIELRLHRGTNRQQPAEELDISATPEVNNLHANDYVYVMCGASQDGSSPQDFAAPKMDLSVQSLDGSTYVIDVGVDDTTEDVRRKVASAAGLSEDSFEMSVGGSGVGEDIAITQLSAGDTIFLTPSMTYEARAMLRDLGETNLTEGRLMCVSDPEVARLFLLAGGVTRIPKFFLQSSRTLTRLDLSAVSVVKEVGHHFLASCDSLTALDVSGFVNVTHIAEGFLFGCLSLRTLDLSRLTNVTHVGERFLLSCRGLLALDLSGFSKVTCIEDVFLSDCTGLSRLDLSALVNVRRIGEYFLSYCTTLTCVDLSGLSGVTHIRSQFLLNCKGLTSINLPPLRNVTTLEKGFLDQCTGLTRIDISGCSSAVEEAVCKKYKGRKGQHVVILKDGVRVVAPSWQKTCSCS